MGLFDSIGSVLGTVGGGVFNLISQNKANDANVALWREQAAYNTPRAQMDRLKEAGLNPNLAYGNLASGVASSPPTMQATKVGSDLQSGLAMHYQIKNMEKQNQLIQAQINDVNQRALSTAYDNAYKKYENDQYIGSGFTKSDNAFLRTFGRGQDSVIGTLGEWLGTVVGKGQRLWERSTPSRPLIYQLFSDDKSDKK